MMFPLTCINYPFAIAETPSEFTDLVMLPPGRSPGTYVLIKPHNQDTPWYWGVLTKEIDTKHSLWEYRRIEPSEIIELIEQDLRENEYLPFAKLDKTISELRSTYGVSAQVS